ncbi:MAG: nucleoside deaminase [Anaeroplasmataceae bacterium]|nr:nucleoside deaminase [Anaeroplasmataceae bacterium]MDE6414923.1 nucleoside deaminase [Anaeroplasmataceae bacterium]
MSTENKFMQMAIKEAQNGIRRGHGGPFGAVIVKNGVVIGKGHNQVVKNNDPTCHGEIMAIHKACKTIQSFDLSGCELYTTGEPCPMCLAAILWANISKVYFGCTIEDTEKIGFRDSIFYQFQKDDKARNAFQNMLDREACLKLYDEYMSIESKTNY